MGHVSLDLVQIEFRLESVLDAIRFRFFSKSPDYKYVPYVIRKRKTSSRLQSTTLGATPPLILGFHPSKRHAALIASCDQCSVFLAFTLVLLVLKHFLWRVMLVILIFAACF